MLQQALMDYGADLDGALRRFLNDNELYEQCFFQFMEDENFALLDEAVRSRDYQRAFEAAHTIKGVAGNMGLTPLYNAASELAEALRAQRYEDVDALYAPIPPQMRVLRTITK